METRSKCFSVYAPHIVLFLTAYANLFDAYMLDFVRKFISSHFKKLLENFAITFCCNADRHTGKQKEIILHTDNSCATRQ